MMKKLLAMVMAASMMFSLAACGNDTTSDSTGANGNTKGEIYYLNFKPEIAEVYEEIAKVYEQETGVKLKVVTAASGTYEQTLKAEMERSDSPTLFQINGPKGYANWQDYCKDLKDTELYKHLTDKSLAVEVNGGVYGIPYVVEGYGIIYNNAIMEKYFALPNKATDVKSVEEINSYEKLKAVVEDMTKNKEALGIKGVFASTSLKPGEDWRWHTHLANIPLYNEFSKNNVDLASDATKEISFEFSDNFKNIYDLYINNSTVSSKLLGTKQVADSMAEFALGQAAMVQNGNWAWSQIKDIDGNTVKEEDVKFMPIYTGIEGEEKLSLATGTENFFAINAKASPEKQKLAEDFIYWLFSSEKGKSFVTNDLGFIAPFDTFEETEVPNDPLAKEVVRWMNNESTSIIPWNFTIFPSQTFKDNFGAALLKYSQGNMEWEAVKTQVVNDWKAESAK